MDQSGTPELYRAGLLTLAFVLLVTRIGSGGRHLSFGGACAVDSRRDFEGPARIQLCLVRRPLIRGIIGVGLYFHFSGRVGGFAPARSLDAYLCAIF